MNRTLPVGYWALRNQHHRSAPFKYHIRSRIPEVQGHVRSYKQKGRGEWLMRVIVTAELADHSHLVVDQFSSTISMHRRHIFSDQLRPCAGCPLFLHRHASITPGLSHQEIIQRRTAFNNILQALLEKFCSVPHANGYWSLFRSYGYNATVHLLGASPLNQ